jgi:hypothetical protein
MEPESQRPVKAEEKRSEDGGLAAPLPPILQGGASGEEEVAKPATGRFRELMAGIDDALLGRVDARAADSQHAPRKPDRVHPDPLGSDWDWVDPEDAKPRES